MNTLRNLALSLLGSGVRDGLLIEPPKPGTDNKDCVPGRIYIFSSPASLSSPPFKTGGPAETLISQWSVARSYGDKTALPRTQGKTDVRLPDSSKGKTVAALLLFFK